MAVVWRATDTLLGRQVAIKRLSPHLKANREASERFRREGQAAARLGINKSSVSRRMQSHGLAALLRAREQLARPA